MGFEFDAIVLGRVEVGFTPDGDDPSRRYFMTVRGDGGGVALAAARLGMRCALISRVGDDPVGGHARRSLAGSGVAHLWVGAERGLRTPVALHEAHPAWGEYRVYGDDPARALSLDDLDLDRISSARLLWTTGTGLVRDPERSATLAALDARSNVEGGVTAHRLDLRPRHPGWDEAALRDCTREALAHATAAVGGERDLAALTGLDDPLEASAALLDLGPRTVFVRRDSGGALVRSPGRVVEVASAEVAEDAGLDGAFGGALCYALGARWEPERALRYACVASVLAASHPAGEMPTLNEIESALARNPAAG